MRWIANRLGTLEAAAILEQGDTELVIRAQQGDAGAFAALVARHRTALRDRARHLAFDAEDAEDIAQETFVAAYEHLVTLRDPAAFGAWLRRIATNLARQRWRRATQASMEPLWDDQAPGSPTAAADAGSAGRIREIVRDALAALPPEPRDAVLLHYFDGYDYQETAALLEVPVSTVRGRLHTARRLLRKEMPQLAPRKPSTKSPAQRQEPVPVLWDGALTSFDLAALRGAAMIASRDPEHEALQSICIEPDGAVAATDTHRLFRSVGSSIRPPRRVLVPHSLFACLAGFPGSASAQLTLTDSEAVLRVSHPAAAPSEREHRVSLFSERHYPNYARVYPDGWKITATLETCILAAALDEMARLAGLLATTAPVDTKQLKLAVTFAGDAGVIAFRYGVSRQLPTSTQWAMKTEIPAAISGLAPAEALSLALNREYLRECLQALSLSPADPVTLRLNDALAPIQIAPGRTEHVSILVMPMVLDPADLVISRQEAPGRG